MDIYFKSNSQLRRKESMKRQDQQRLEYDVSNKSYLNQNINYLNALYRTDKARNGFVEPNVKQLKSNGLPTRMIPNMREAEVMPRSKLEEDTNESQLQDQIFRQRIIKKIASFKVERQLDARRQQEMDAQIKQIQQEVAENFQTFYKIRQEYKEHRRRFDENYPGFMERMQKQMPDVRARLKKLYERNKK